MVITRSILLSHVGRHVRTFVLLISIVLHTFSLVVSGLLVSLLRLLGLLLLLILGLLSVSLCWWVLVFFPLLGLKNKILINMT